MDCFAFVYQILHTIEPLGHSIFMYLLCSQKTPFNRNLSQERGNFQITYTHRGAQLLNRRALIAIAMQCARNLESPRERGHIQQRACNEAEVHRCAIVSTKPKYSHTHTYSSCRSSVQFHLCASVSVIVGSTAHYSVALCA